MKNIFIILISLFLIISCEEIINEKDISNYTVNLIAPANNTQLTDTIVNFSWNLVDGATEYQLQVAKPSFTNATQIVLDTVIDQINFTKELQNSNYQWRVKALNGAYETTYNTNMFSILSEVNFSDNTIVLQSPAENLITNQAIQTLKWEAVTGATKYHIQLWKPDTNGSLELNEITTTNQKDITFSDGNFTWQVSAETETETTSYTSRTLLVDATVPNTPILLTPTDNENLTDTNVTFTWQRTTIEGSTETDKIFIYSDENLTTLVHESNVTDSTYSHTLIAGNTYYWVMQSFDEAGNESTVSDTFSFSIPIDISASTITLQSPADNLITNQASQNLIWEAVTGATKYHIQLWKPDTNGSLELNEITTTNQKDITFTDGNFTWQVRAENDTGTTSYTSRTLLVDTTTPNTPILLTPTDNENLTDANVTFTWQRDEIEGSTESDKIYIYSDASLTTLVHENSVADSTYSHTLTAGNTYYWVIQSFDEAGNESTVSDTFSFSIPIDISASTITLQSPADNLITNQASHNLIWEAITGATIYRIQVWQPDTNGTLILDETSTTNQKNITFNDGTFVWQVRAENDTTNSPYTSRTILVDTVLPNIPILLTPTDNENLTDTNVTFTWQRDEITGSTETDKIFIYSDVNLTTLIHQNTVTNNSYDYTLTTGNTYYWNMKSFDEAGNESVVSNTFSFTIN